MVKPLFYMKSIHRAPPFTRRDDDARRADDASSRQVASQRVIVSIYSIRFLLPKGVRPCFFLSAAGGFIFCPAFLYLLSDIVAAKGISISQVFLSPRNP